MVFKADFDQGMDKPKAQSTHEERGKEYTNKKNMAGEQDFAVVSDPGTTLNEFF